MTPTPPNPPDYQRKVAQFLKESRTHLTVQDHLEDVRGFLERHALVADAGRQTESGGPENPADDTVRVAERERHLAELRARLEPLHPADVAYVLEGLPLADRLLVWDLVKAERDGEILLEVSDAVRETLIASMDQDELVAAAGNLDTDEIADLAPDLPPEVVEDILESQDVEDRADLQAALSYAEGTVGALMDFEEVTIREDVSVEAALRYLRRFDELPSQLDALFVADRADRLIGILPLKTLLVSDPDAQVADLMLRDFISFMPADDADTAASAFERYDLVCAPVVDVTRKIVGRVTVDAVVDYIREAQESKELSQAGLREEEDIFSSVWKSAQNRWPWLAINLVTAFIASRVIGAFEGSIAKLAALAALMPIVAGVGGNTGNQTVTLLIRALALGQMTQSSSRRLLAKEIGISLVNGVMWGSVMGAAAFLLYGNVSLGLVMAGAMTLNLIVAALAGMFIPLALHRMGRDPAFGSSVLLTATTDSMGFFIFLGLATVFLV